MRANISGAGKGSGRRPTLANAQVVNDNWERIFGKKGSTESNSQRVYKFRNFSMAGDEVDEKTGKVKKYQEIYVVSTSVESARTKGKVTEDWTFVSDSPLGEDWQ